MSGFVRNDWSKFLNGGQSYNFKYKDEAPPAPEPMPVPPPPPPTTAAPAQSPPKNVVLPAPLPMIEPLSTRNKKGKKAIMPSHIGGKRKTRRHSKKRRHSRRHHK